MTRPSLFLGLLAPLFLAPLAPGQTLRRAHVATDDPAQLEARLAALGFDVVRTSARDAGRDTGLEVVGSANELAALRAQGLALEVLEVGRPMRKILAERVLAEGVPAGYEDLAGLYARMAQAAADHPAICQLVDLTAQYGTPMTAEGRHLFAVRISDTVAVDEDEPAVLVVGGHHARELVTPVIALEAIDRLTDGYGAVPAVTAAVDSHEIWFAPTWNPDGYEHVFNADNLWRKNRRVFPTGIGVDLNRNYPQGWSNSCSGSTSAGSSTYKGPSAASEAETQTLLAWAQDRRFAKVLDLHSRGREVLWGYDCPSHPFDGFWQSEAAQLSAAASYQGDERTPSADGEHQQWHLARQGAMANLIETATDWQPPYNEALSEAALVWGAIEWVLARPLSISGHVTDACGGAPLQATITKVGVAGVPDESNSSGGAFGRWHAYLPVGSLTLRFEAPGYMSEDHLVQIGTGALTLDVTLEPTGNVTSYCPLVPNSVGAGAVIGHAGSTSASANDFTLTGFGLPTGQFALFVYGQGQTQQPLFDGYLCVASPFIRLPVLQSSIFGLVQYALDLSSPPQPSGLILPGSTWNFQLFYRDPGLGTGSNLSHALTVQFCP